MVMYKNALAPLTLVRYCRQHTKGEKLLRKFWQYTEFKESALQLPGELGLPTPRLTHFTG